MASARGAQRWLAGMVCDAPPPSSSLEDAFHALTYVLGALLSERVAADVAARGGCGVRRDVRDRLHPSDLRGHDRHLRRVRGQRAEPVRHGQPLLLLENAAARFRYLHLGLAAILAYIGAKLILGDVWHPPSTLGLAVVVGALVAAGRASSLRRPPGGRASIYEVTPGARPSGSLWREEVTSADVSGRRTKG